MPQPHCTVRGANAKELTDKIYDYPARVNRSLSLRASHADRKITDKLKQSSLSVDRSLCTTLNYSNKGELMSSQLLSYYLSELECRGPAMRDVYQHPNVTGRENLSVGLTRKEQIDRIRNHLAILSNFVEYVIDLALCATGIL